MTRGRIERAWDRPHPAASKGFSFYSPGSSEKSVLSTRRPSGTGSERTTPSRVNPARSSTRSDGVLPTFTYAATRLYAEREGMLGEQARDRGRDTPPTCMWKHEVADLDDCPLGIEMVERAAAYDLARLGVERCER